jgi:hypothetical protein
MKKIISLLVVILLICSAGFAQKVSSGKLPSPVKKAFKADFPKNSKAEWTMDSLNYEVNFLVNDVKNSATYDKDGKWLEKEATINLGQIPKDIKASITKNFPGFHANMAEKVETNGKETEYLIGIYKGKEKYEVLFSLKGDIIKKEVKVTEPPTTKGKK